MIKLLIFLNLICLSASSYEKKNDIPKKGIIGNRPEIAVSKLTQYSVNTDNLHTSSLDPNLQFNQTIVDSLTKWSNEVKIKGNYKGLSFAIGIPQKGFWASAIGESGTATRLDPQTKFHSLSIGKIFTAALAIKFIEQQKINIDDKINRWFPECPRANEISIKHLLCHTSGIQTYEALYEFEKSNSNSFSEQDLLSMSYQYPIKKNPDTYLSYTNTGYIMLGCILQQVSNKNLSQLFNEYFISPLKLKNTTICTKEGLDMGIVRGYDDKVLNDVSQWPLTYGAGPVISTPTEITLMYNYLLSTFFSSKESLKLMLADMNIWMKSPDTYYGKGIYIIKDLPIGDYLGHAGGDKIFRTSLFYNPQNDIYISIFSNTNSSPIEPAFFYITEKLNQMLKINNQK